MRAPRNREATAQTRTIRPPLTSSELAADIVLETRAF